MHYIVMLMQKLASQENILRFLLVGHISVIDPSQPREEHHPSVPKHSVEEQLPCFIFPCQLR